MKNLLTPEHLHVALNHVPLVGLAIACIPLAYSVFKREKAVLFIGLLIVVVCSVSVPLVMKTGENAAVRLGGGVYDVIDEEGREWMFTHYRRAEIVEKVVYGVLCFSLLGLFTMWKFSRFQYTVGWIVLSLCLITTILLIWVADTGGKIRHAEFRWEQSRK